MNWKDDNKPINNKTNRNVIKHEHFNVRSLTVLCRFPMKLFMYMCRVSSIQGNVWIKRCLHPGCRVNMVTLVTWTYSLKLRHLYYMFEQVCNGIKCDHFMQHTQELTNTAGWLTRVIGRQNNIWQRFYHKRQIVITHDILTQIRDNFSASANFSSK